MRGVIRCLMTTGAALAVGLSASPLVAQDVVTTADVDLLALEILDEIEVLRWNMGRPVESRPPIPVRAVSIRENFRQAMVLWRKVNQLGMEMVGGGESPPIVIPQTVGDYTPPEVHQVLTSVQDRLQEIRDGTAIVMAEELTTGESQPILDPSATPTHVFQSIVQANRQVNRMLQRRAEPGDVYQQVQQATFYAAQILTAMGAPNPFATTPAYEAGVRPEQVYGRLLTVFDRMAIAFEILNLDMLEWGGGASHIDESLNPSDVLDIATLLVSELEYLHSRLPETRAPIIAEHPGQRWPSDVLQQAGVLAEQASMIVVRARSNPNALASNR